VAEHCKGNERYGHLNDDRAEREQPDFSLGLRIHGSPNAQRHGSFQGSRIWRASGLRRRVRVGMPTLKRVETDTARKSLAIAPFGFLQPLKNPHIIIA
jgi:hypothetical protein